MGLPERLGETAVAEGYSTHIHLIWGPRSLWDGCLFCRDASQSCHDRAVIGGDPDCALIPLAVYPDVWLQ